ncbi:hypothetical protein [Blastococcus brunescens]|uniref:Mandelate racemase/muconate lactonizing enzyme N-terminal domain-containing protein n=1 Tax=Blastococcus brunescens TaxID=1564165 RepID=A0ABZ1AWI7_9ACTN|nr:hypothetical protein [Blastococcus sp. BMG 8361]WRL62870.1 hypothetical protein U6N30_23765 [Blastococcus sp. BMG 8361]
MRITDAEILTCAAGTRYWSYLKISTDDGVTGWAEFTDGMLSAHGMAGVVRRLASFVLGEDPTCWRRIEQLLRSRTREAEDGLNRRAVGTVVNACLDVAARARGLSVAELLGDRCGRISGCTGRTAASAGSGSPRRGWPSRCAPWTTSGSWVPTSPPPASPRSRPTS